MKNVFFEFYPITREEKNLIWNSALFCLDTNTLLNVYRYSTETAEKFIENIKSKADSITIVHQVAMEYHKKRIKVILEQKQKSNETLSKFNELEKILKNERAMPYLSNTTNELLLENFEMAKEEIKKQQNLISSYILNDPYLDIYTQIFNKNLSSNNHYNDQEEAKWNERYEKKIPPGYMDNNKSENKFGDLIIWHQLISLAKSNKKNIVFITDDNKEDWWHKEEGKKIGPRFELRKEFREKTEHDFLLASPKNFIESIQSLSTNDHRDEYIKEIEYVSKNKTKQIILNSKKISHLKLKDLEIDLKSKGYNVEISFQNEEPVIIVTIPNISEIEERLLRVLIKHNFPSEGIVRI